MTDDFTIKVRPESRGRLHISIERGMYVSSFDVTTAEAAALVETLHDALGTSQADDSR